MLQNMTDTKNYIKGNTGPWEIVVGLEVHAQITSKAKLFSGASTDFGAEPNSQVDYLDAGMPGMLPVLNKYCVEQAIRTGLGLNAQINLYSVFDRKNYFYADLPLGYQISQFAHPIVGEGVVTVDLEDSSTKEIRIHRLHLEIDAGKSVHDLSPDHTYIDLNRAGVALMEIVSEPDIRSSAEAAAYIRKLRTILRYLGTCDGNMEQGSMRCDVNVSVRRPGDEFGTRCEIKNVNSVRFMQQAIEYEARRQVEILEDGGEIKQETRLWDAVKGESRSLRSKEEAHDYRYFPDPDLMPLQLEQKWVDEIKASLPELPDQKIERFMKDFGVTHYDASVLVGDRQRADFFESIVKGRDSRLVVTWVTGELFGALNRLGLEIEQSPISADHLAELIDLISKGTISNRMAKDVFAEMLEDSSKTASQIVKEKGLEQVSDTGALEAMVTELLSENPSMVADYKAGKEKVFGFFVGQIMKKSQGKANPQMINELLMKALKG
jgi:aspartyl-tRNA(Asn)/glutamyl-tRNA(Gln) amidotransferase subunit B